MCNCGAAAAYDTAHTRSLFNARHLPAPPSPCVGFASLLPSFLPSLLFPFRPLVLSVFTQAPPPPSFPPEAGSSPPDVSAAAVAAAAAAADGDAVRKKKDRVGRRHSSPELAGRDGVLEPAGRERASTLS